MNAAPAFDCQHCHDLRVIQHAKLGPVRCARCRTIEPLRVSARELTTILAAAEREQDAIDRGDAEKFTGLDWTICKLNEWGRWVRDRTGGYPSMAATEKARVGRGGRGELNTELPPDLRVIDEAVAMAPVDYKAVLVEHYTKHGLGTEKAAHLGVSRQTYYLRKRSAERHIATAIGV